MATGARWPSLARIGAGPEPIKALSGGGKRTPTQPDTSRNRPAGAPLRPPVIDGIEEHDPTGRIEELDFLESGSHDREPPGFEPDTSRSPPPRRPNTPCHPCARLTNIDVSC